MRMDMLVDFYQNIFGTFIEEIPNSFKDTRIRCQLIFFKKKIFNVFYA